MSQAQYNLGVLTVRDPALKNGRNFPETRKWWQRAATSGNAEAQNALGVSYFKGFGAEQNHTAAVRWFTKAAEQGLSEAQVNLDAMYENSHGTARNRVQAYKWYVIAAARGLGKAVANRDRMAPRMNTAKRREGQRLARNWLAANPG